MTNRTTANARDWVRKVEESIGAAQEGRSNLLPQVLAIAGMTSPRVKHFLNNLCRGDDVVYLEVGSWQGATITAASCRNAGRFTAIENFGQGGKREFDTNRRASAEWCRYGLVEGDCWQTPTEQVADAESVNVYFYDGAHDHESQVKAFLHFEPLLARTFVAVVDDWDHPPVRKGTRVAFDRLGFEVVREWELPARFNGDTENWWNGLYIAVVTKRERSRKTGTGSESSRCQSPFSGIGSEAPRLTAAVVIPCHNYGHWLPEAVESVLAQTRPPREIVVVDDSSDDDSPRVAARYAPRGVRYLRIEAGSVWEARKAGYRATTADVLCFLDADDRLAPDYLEQGLRCFDSSRVGVVYSDFEQFDETTGRSNHPAYDRARLEVDNFMHAGSLVRRQAVEVARGFDAPTPNNSHADWFLWRKLGDAGFTAVKQPALYYYRRHRGSMILQAAQRKVSHYEFADLRYQPVTIVSPLSGRAWAWDRYRDWLERQLWPREHCALLVIDSGPTPRVREWLSACEYPDTHYLAFEPGARGLADRPRAENAGAVRLAVARIYNRAARLVGTPFAFVLEDDVIPGYDVIDRLMRSMEKRVAAVTGTYRSRFVPGYVAWRIPGQHLPGGTGVEEIGGCGFGCLLVRRAVLEGETFASLPREHPDYDIAFFARLREAGWKIKIDWDAHAEHLTPPGVRTTVGSGKRT